MEPQEEEEVQVHVVSSEVYQLHFPPSLSVSLFLFSRSADLLTIRTVYNLTESNPTKQLTIVAKNLASHDFG